MKLVIVESPAKCTTIKKYLGDEYKVMASFGHVRDLSTSGKGGLGVDTENGFTPTYIINKDKAHVVYELQAAAREADEVILATDPDREGEAIAWHLAKILNLNVDTTKRLEFHEITRESIKHAMENPRTIDKNLVSSQETRRILDRIIGFRLSTLLFKKIKSRSAGRVQSATLKMIADHDNEIDKFVPEEYWNLNTKVKIGSKDFSLTFQGKNGKTVEIHNSEEAAAILAQIPDKMRVISANKTIRIKESKEPFTTSTLQQEAFARLKFKTKKTQSVAQSLYEGISIGDDHAGLITYMRTDSTRLAPVFIERARSYIAEKFGDNFIGKVKKGKASEMMQDAHEAIRPTSCHRTPESIKQYLSNEQYNLYKLIYNRAIASLMAPKKEEVLTVLLDANGYEFKVELAHTVFPGYEAVLQDVDGEKEYKGSFPNVDVDSEFDISSKTVEQKFTQAPARYSEAKIVKLMEEVGIGRPSTYASTIDTLYQRKYVTNSGGILTTTEQGKKTSHVLDKYFPSIVDVKYTADMESKLDSVQDGSDSRVNMLTKFYKEFSELLAQASEAMYKDPLEETGRFCPKCGSPLVYKDGKNGRFVGCSNYPSCKYVEKQEAPAPEYTGETCPKCGKPMVKRTDKAGNVFEACSGFPTCKYIKQNQVTIEYKESDYVKPCPNCGGHLVKKKGKYGYFLGCTNYPTCNYMEKIKKSKRK